MNYNLIHSLHKDTLVNINGSSVKLETIQIGDLVQGRDLANGVNRDNRVTQIATGTLHQYLKFKLSDGSTLKTSVDIKIYKMVNGFHQLITNHVDVLIVNVVITYFTMIYL